MRITIENTVSEPQYSVKSVVEVPYDDVDLEEARRLVEQAIWGFGFLPDAQLKGVNSEDK